MLQVERINAIVVPAITVLAHTAEDRAHNKVAQYSFCLQSTSQHPSSRFFAELEAKQTSGSNTHGLSHWITQMQLACSATTRHEKKDMSGTAPELDFISGPNLTG